MFYNVAMHNFQTQSTSVSFKNTLNTNSYVNSRVWYKHNKLSRIGNNQLANYIKPSQEVILFFKKKLGLYKNNDFIERRLKQKLIGWINAFKDDGRNQRFRANTFIRKPKIFFYKKFSTLFFRAGRMILKDFFSFKKYVIQRYLTRKISRVIKHNWMRTINSVTITDILIKSNIFYTYKDAADFVSTVGLVVNGNYVYDPKYKVHNNSTFFIMNNTHFYKYLRKKKQRLFKLYARVKFYKYRVKTFTRHRATWLPLQEWLTDTSVLYANKNRDVEFDIRVLGGVYLHNRQGVELFDFYQKMNLSLFMTRSYNWKFLV